MSYYEIENLFMAGFMVNGMQFIWEQTVTVDTTDGTLEIPVDEGTIDLLFTIECNVVNPITTEIGTQEVRVGKTHTVKTDKFELMNGVILDCEWGDGAAAADAQ